MQIQMPSGGEFIHCESVRRYTWPNEDRGKVVLYDSADHGGRRPDQEVDRLVRTCRARHPTLTYSQALDSVLADPDNAALKVAYARVAA